MAEEASVTLLRDRSACLKAIFDTVIPPDEWKGAWDGGVERLLAEGFGGVLAWAVVPLSSLCEILDQQSRDQFGLEFADLGVAARVEIFEAATTAAEGEAGREAAVTIADYGFYAGHPAPEGWSMLGFNPAAEIPQDTVVSTGVSYHDLAESYDVIVIGAGAGGGVAAAELAARGERVLLIDRSRPMSTAELRNDHLRGKRMQIHDLVAGAGAGSPRVLELPDGTTRILRGDGDGDEYGLNAMTLGGGTRLWQGMSWRFYAEDFRMVSTYGLPENSTLADWPFGYDELAPYYDRVESDLGVSGDANSPMALRTPRPGAYPMPAMPSDDIRVTLGAAAHSLGWSTSPIPFAINSVARDGRRACIRCVQCIGHSCPVNAKNGTHNTFIPRAIATGNCDLLLSAQALAIEHDSAGVATAVRMVIEAEAGPVERQIQTRTVIVSAGAIESSRLLMVSGLGNDWVGRNHLSHGLAGATALSGAIRTSYLGPGHSVASVDWVHRNGEAWGGGVMFDAAPMYPLAQARLGRQLPGLGWGEAHKKWMRSHGLPLGTRSMVQEIPDMSSRVTLDPTVVDRWGMPVARLAGHANPATQVAVDYMARRCVEWLEAAGGRDIFPVRVMNAPQGAEHSAGTIRLASDPAFGACDPQGRLFGTRNVYVADGSLHPTNGGFNPGLTIMANAMRVASLTDR